MQTSATITSGDLATLLRGDVPVLSAWTERLESRRIAFHIAVIFLGAGLYGAAMGWWRSPTQAMYVAIKFPVIVLLVAGGNALLNAMLAPLLGLNIGLRQSFLAVLMSFTVAAAILGSFSPLLAYLVWNAPPLTPESRTADSTYTFIQLTQVVVIAFAGVAANARLFQLLVRWSGRVTVAWRVLFAWLAGNLFLGSQLCWVFRPFIGTPGLPVQFLRENPFRGSFYETVFGSILHLLQSN